MTAPAPGSDRRLSGEAHQVGSPRHRSDHEQQGPVRTCGGGGLVPALGCTCDGNEHTCIPAICTVCHGSGVPVACPIGPNPERGTSAPACVDRRDSLPGLYAGGSSRVAINQLSNYRCRQWRTPAHTDGRCFAGTRDRGRRLTGAPVRSAGRIHQADRRRKPGNPETRTTLRGLLRRARLDARPARPSRRSAVGGAPPAPARVSLACSGLRAVAGP